MAAINIEDASTIPVTPKLRKWVEGHQLAIKGSTDEQIRKSTVAALLDESLSGTKLIELCGSDESEDEMETETTTQTKADKLFGSKGGDIRVKAESEKYSAKRFTGKHRKTGEPVIFQGSEVELPSQKDAAYLGCLIKHAASKSVPGVTLEGSERDLLTEMCAKETWCGQIGNEHFDEIKDAGSGRIKAILDDTTSGGIYLAPVAVDQNVVVTPLLEGEVFPFVDVQNLTRGRRIEGAAISNPTFSSGGADGSDIPIFSTTSMISQIGATVFVENVSIEIGRDMLSDSIVELGSLIQQLLGTAFSAKLDYNCALGDGTTQPQGLFVASGITTITPDNTTTGPPTLADFTNLQFGVGKAYRQPGQCRFLSNDTSYARSRQIRVDPHVIGTTVNQTPVLSDVNSFQNYQTMGWGHSVQNDIANGRCIFGNLKRGYRMWRRSGLEIEVQTAGKTLALANKALIVARARFAGKVVDASAFCKWTNGQS